MKTSQLSLSVDNTKQMATHFLDIYNMLHELAKIGQDNPITFRTDGIILSINFVSVSVLVNVLRENGEDGGRLLEINKETTNVHKQSIVKYIKNKDELQKKLEELIKDCRIYVMSEGQDRIKLVEEENQKLATWFRYY